MSLAHLASLLVAAAPPAADAPVSRGPLSVRVEAEGLAPQQVQAMQRATHAVLGALVPWELREDEGAGACADEACLMRLAGEGYAVEVTAGITDRTLEVRAAFADPNSGQIVRKTVRGGSLQQPEKALQLVLDAALPQWTRKGQASVAVKAPQDSVVKVDGRRVALVPLPEPMALPVGVHEIDVLLPTGEAMLVRQRLGEGERLLLSADAVQLGATANAGEASARWRRPVAYGLWSAGALAVAGSLVAGGLSQRAGAQLQPCGVGDRDCLRIDQAERAAQRAERYAGAGNALLIGGAVLGASGAGLFVFDLVGGAGAGGRSE